jgi:hypothetical protein
MHRLNFRRSFLLVITTWLAGSSLLGQSARGDNWAEKMFENKSHDFRTVGRGTKTEHFFEFVNPYKEDVHIAAVRTSCGCTTPTITSDTVSTHQNGSVVATFNTNTHIGEKAAVITVVFDKPTYAEVQLKVKGHIRTDITFDPPEIDFGEVLPGVVEEREVVITHTGSTNWEIRDVRSHCQNLRVRLAAPERTPGMIRYRMKVKLDGQAAEGDLRQRLTLVSNDPAFPTTEMAINGRIKPTINISPSAVSMGILKLDSTASKRLIVQGEKPFAITGVQCPDPRFTFEIPEGQKKIQMINMIFTGDGTDKGISHEVLVETDLPGNKSAICIVTGSVLAN